jgi:hypothetical protein
MGERATLDGFKAPKSRADNVWHRTNTGQGEPSARPISTNACVKVADLYVREFKLFVPVDCVGALDDEDQLRSCDFQQLLHHLVGLAATCHSLKRPPSIAFNLRGLRRTCSRGRILRNDQRNDQRNAPNEDGSPGLLPQPLARLLRNDGSL